MDIANWQSKVHGVYVIETAPISLVGTKETWAYGVIPGCYYADGHGYSCPSAAQTRIRLRGGQLVQDDDRLACWQHLETFEKEMLERIQILNDTYQWLKAWAEANPLESDSSKSNLSDQKSSG